MSDHSITSLIEKLEGAEVGSRELDCRIMAVFDRVDGEAWTAGDLEIALEDPDRTVNPPHFTTSLDAALALAERVLPGWEVSITNRVPRPGETCAEWWRGTLFEIGGTYHDVKAATAPLALCAAILRAQSEARV